MPKQTVNIVLRDLEPGETAGALLSASAAAVADLIVAEAARQRAAGLRADGRWLDGQIAHASRLLGGAIGGALRDRGELQRILAKPPKAPPAAKRVRFRRTADGLEAIVTEAPRAVR
jgi:hypothetical protein